MDASMFTSQMPGWLKDVPPEPPRVPEGILAFVPNPLPTTLALDLATIRLLSTADHLLGELSGLGRQLPNPQLMVRPFLDREAVLSSRIEGTTTTVRELIIHEEEDPSKPQRGDHQEVVNYVRTMRYGLSRLETLPLSLRFLRELHRRLMRGVRGQGRAGEFRDIQNYVGSRDRGIQDARFIPPPVSELTSALDAFEHYLAEARELPPLIHVALVHYQFETIHPFGDGNGRIGRLLSALQLCAKEFYSQEPLLHNPHLYLSAYFEAHRQDYYDHLLAVGTQGAWRQWIEFFLTAVISQSQNAIERSNKLLALWEELRGDLQTVRSSSRLLQLLDNLFARPVTTVPRAQRLLGVTYRAASMSIQKLVDAGILEELPENLRPKMYIANRIVDILQEE